MATDNLTVANTILAQMGGSGRLTAMIGAHSFVGGKDSLSFRFKAKSHKGINTIRVVLTPADVYTVEFCRIRGFKLSLVETVADVYCDQLIETVERVTGLYLHL